LGSPIRALLYGIFLFVVGCNQNLVLSSPFQNSSNLPSSGSGGNQSQQGLTAVQAFLPPIIAPKGGCPNGTGGDPGYCDFFTYVAPHISGVVLYLPWKDIDNGTQPCIEGSKSQPCQWTAFDNQVLPFINAGLKVSLIITPDSDTSPNLYTPKYVFTSTYATLISAPPQDQAVCAQWPGASTAPVIGTSTVSGVWNVNSCYSTNGTCAGSSDISGLPVVYEVPFMTAYENFIANVVKHYSPAGVDSGPQIFPHIQYVRFGMAEGGENHPLCYTVWPGPQGLASQPLGYTASAYLTGTPGYNAAILKYIRSLNPQFKVVISTIDGPNFDVSYADTEAQLAAANGIGMGTESLSMTDYYDYSNNLQCPNDWCANFASFAKSNLNFYLQTANPGSLPVFSLSKVSGNGNTATATCTQDCTLGLAGGLMMVQISGNSVSAFDAFVQPATNSGSVFTFPTTSKGTGNGGVVYSQDYLPQTLPFTVAAHANALEIYTCDLFYAFDPNSISACTAPGSYSSQYASTLTSILNGN
jgi:hypothetical protein